MSDAQSDDNDQQTTEQSTDNGDEELRTYRVPMKMVKTAEVEVTAQSEDEAADMMEMPRDADAESALQTASWRFSEYETDFTWDIEEVDGGK